MQAPDDPALAAAVTAADRVPLARLLVDWARDARFAHTLSDLSTVVDTVTVERAITGDLPAECTLVEGFSAASLTATLTGTRAQDPHDIARMFSPYGTGATLLADDQVDAPLTLDLGLTTRAGPRLLRQFTGTTRTVRVNARNRTVTVEALDPAERLRGAVTLPVGAAEERTYRNTAFWIYRDRVNTQWVVDFVLRRNGIYMSPPPRPGCIWAMTCHGGLYPDIGFNRSVISGDKTTSAVPEFVAGRYGLAANGGPEIRSLIGSRTAGVGFNFGTRGVGHVFDFHIKAGASNAFHPYSDGTIVQASTSRVTREGATVEILISTNGQLSARVLYNPTTNSNPVVAATIPGPTITGAADWHSVGFWITYDIDNLRVFTRWHLDGVQTATVTTPANVQSLVGQTRGHVYLNTCLPVQCVQIAEAAAPPAGWGVPHVSQADLDTGLNWMTGLPDIVGADSWTVIKAAVAAEYGLVAFTEHGRFRFTARAKAPPAPVKTISANVDLADLDLSTSLDGVRNEITFRHAPRLERVSAVVYTARTIDELDTGALNTRFLTLPLDKRARLSTTLLRYTKAEWPTAASGGYVVVNANTGAEVTSSVTVTLGLVDGDAAAAVVISNANTFPIRFANGSEPAFKIRGFPVTDDPPLPTTLTDTASAARFGRRVLDLPDSGFRHHPAAAADVAASVLADLARPTPVLADIPVVGDPRVQLGDVVTLTDPTGLGGPITGSVIALRRSHSTSEGLTDRLTLRTRPPA
ncbi:hypothetical protein [Alloactinosynnema sp. L-07]|uniref:hypothetical protein n=1 Tax=Alloactinosynnema sp. L-07 TaxID=1653480 RepID=UPI00065EF4DE|nr:hypothetical protein [Alloactinosynnema sp. L-07]CRK55421.1 hypothetical protein [Alloactinosynnema sp. L-07]